MAGALGGHLHPVFAPRLVAVAGVATHGAVPHVARARLEAPERVRRPVHLIVLRRTNAVGDASQCTAHRVSGYRLFRGSFGKTAEVP